MIAVSQIKKTFDKVQALQGISFKVNPGELCGLLGPNGAGKSTLFKIIMGLLFPDQGTVIFEDKVLSSKDFSYKNDIGYAPETPVLYEYLTGAEFLQFIACAKQIPPGEQQKEIQRWFEFFRLQEKAGELITNYSHGMRRKLSLSAAIMGKPKLLLLDEATNGLDPETSFYFKSYLQDFCKAGGTVIFSSHIIETIENLCQRIVILHLGQVIREMNREEWQQSSQQGSSLEEVFIRLIQTC